jgi:hypothetical protein
LFGLSFYGALYRIDKTTGVPTLVGGDPIFNAPHAMAFAPDGTLYATDNGPRKLLTIDPATGKATRVAEINRPIIDSLAFNSTGVMYGLDANSITLVSIDRTTGNATAVRTGIARGAIAFVIPEPATMIMLSAGTVVLGSFRRRAPVPPNRIVLPYAKWLLISLVFVRQTQADVIIDQEVRTYPDSGYIGYILDYPGDYLAQTFTARHSGQLAGVGIQVSLNGIDHPPYPPPIDDLHLRIVRTDSAGVPMINEVLAEATIDRFSLQPSIDPGEFVDVVQVTAGDVLAITFSSDQTYYVEPHVGTDYIWYRSPRNEISGGEFYIYSPSIFGPEPFKNHYVSGDDRTIDAGFRVIIDVIPEPASISLAAMCMCWLSGRRYFRRQRCWHSKHAAGHVRRWNRE